MTYSRISTWGNDRCSVLVVQVSNNIVGTYFDFLVLEVSSAYMQSIVFPLTRWNRLSSILSHSCHQLRPRALDGVLVTHEISDEPLVEAGHRGRAEEDEGVVVLQDAVLAVSREEDVPCLLQFLINPHDYRSIHERGASFPTSS